MSMKLYLFCDIQACTNSPTWQDLETGQLLCDEHVGQDEEDTARQTNETACEQAEGEEGAE